uniref:G-protein coupled receptors family 1 profile domain-containing protein n=1 Tax=Leptobrachium leishanense TaxID=445787 RepID=A0A8C5LUP9_9ANUR
MSSRHNQSDVHKFFLLGFQVLHSSRIILFISFLVVYISTIYGNLLIIVLVSTTRHLHSPMYFFLSHLSFCDILLCSTVVPNFLWVTLHNVTGCLIQFHIFSFSSRSECILFPVMSYDRYVAICKPLHYQTIMNVRVCLGLVLYAWIFGLGLMSIVTLLLSLLDFCYSGDIDHFFCDYAPLIQLSCSDTTVVQLVGIALGTPHLLIETMFIISTYVCIFLAIHRISSTTGKQKAFSTCSSHLAVVCICYGILMAIYIFSAGDLSVTVTKILSLMYTVVTPLLNPIIYSLRNQDITRTMKRYWTKWRKML